MYCNACKETFCQECLTFFHRKEEKKIHLKEDVSPVNKMNFKCSNHNNKKLKTFCNDCKSFLCDECLIVNSNNHKFHELKEMNDKTIDLMIKYTSNIIKQRISNEKTKLRSQFDEIYERKFEIVNPLNFYVSKMKQWDKFDRLNVPLSHQLFSIKKDFLLNPTEKFTKIEHSLFLESEEILKAREDIKPLFSDKDEFHKEDDELFYQWANKIVFEGKQITVGNFHKFKQKPTKHLMNNMKLLEDSFHIVKSKYTKEFSLIVQFDSFSHFTEIEIYENFNAGALKKIEFEYSMNEPSIFNWETVWTLSPRTMNFKSSRVYKPTLNLSILKKRVKFAKLTFEISSYQLNSKYQIAGICLFSKKEHHPTLQTISMGNSLFSDVNVYVKDGEETTLIKSHKIILCKSLKFSNVLIQNPNLEEIRIECPIHIFLKILNWMYCGKLTHKESNIELIRKFCIHFEITELISLLK
jgi:hypothetical protein